jgi:hypothetical protein
MYDMEIKCKVTLMDEVIDKLSRAKIANNTKKRKYPYYPSGKYLNHVYGPGKTPATVRIKKDLMKEAIKDNRTHMKRSSAAKKIQTTMMPYNNVFRHKSYPARFAIKLGDRIYDSRSLARWFQTHNSLPRPWSHVEISNKNKERVRRYNRRKLYRHGKRAYDLESSQFDALGPVEKRRRLDKALEILYSH